METEQISAFHFPPGFRFHPSDEELIVHYLMNKVKSWPLPACVITEVELYNYNPWELPKKALFGEDEWYFFSPRDRKYPNGGRPNRTAASGFWKATGTDKPIISSSVSRTIGFKKTLVFYMGRCQNSFKTDWVMNEYRLPDTSTPSSRPRGSMRLDDWVICRVRQKGNVSKNTCDTLQSPTTEIPRTKELPSEHTDATPELITDFNLPKDCPIIASLLTGQNFLSIQTISGATFHKNDKANAYDSGQAKPSYNCTSSFLDSLLNTNYINFSNQNISRGDIFYANLPSLGGFLQE